MESNNHFFVQRNTPVSHLSLKFRLWLCLILSVFVSKISFAQETRFSFLYENISIKRAIKEIERKSDYSFIYNSNIIDVRQKVNLVSSGTALKPLLDNLFRNTHITYEIIGRQVVLFPAKTHVEEINTGANYVIEGNVSDVDLLPLAGVAIFIKGTDSWAVTDESGHYSLKVPGPNSVLIFSYIGFQKQEISFSGQKRIDVVMTESITGLNEVIVIGYGTGSRKLLAGSYGRLTSDDIQETAAYCIEGSMAGKNSGVQIIQNSGTPGSSMAIRIRGTASLYSGTQPLYVIDGIPVTTGNFSQIGYGGQGIDASTDINPDNIESITILKDASAAAIYGARAANGVILVTTKKGKAGEHKISYRTWFGFQHEWRRLDLMNTTEWLQWVSSYNPELVSQFDPTISTNWQEEVFRMAPLLNCDLSYGGGNEKTQLYLSSGFLHQQGIILGTGFKKYSLRSNIDHNLSDKFRFSLRNGLVYSINNRVRGDVEIDGVLPNALSLPPVHPVYDQEGNYAEFGYFSNPVATANESTNQAKSFRNISSLELSYRLFDKLVIKNQLGVDFYHLNERRIEPLTTRIGLETNGMIIEGSSDVSKLTQQLLAEYNYTYNDLHTIQFLFGYSFEIQQRVSKYIFATNFPTSYPKYIISAGNINRANTNAVDEGINSVFGRFKYNYADKYILEFSARRDGSSRFGGNNKYAVLPAVSLAWRLIEEPFMKTQSFFNDFKLRIGYGLTGNDQIGTDRYQNLYITGRNYYGLPGIVPRQIPNPDLKWETSSSFNAGMDLSVFKGRITFSTEYYYNLTRDLLLPRTLPGSSGFSSYMTNVGSILNRGMEFTLNSVNLDNSLIWKTNFTLAFNENRVIELYNGQPLYLNTRGNNALIEGYPVGVFYMYQSLGVDSQTGDLVLLDRDKNGMINDNDKLVAGNPNPLFTGGITNTITYRGFDLKIFFQYVYGNEIYNGTRRYLENNALGEKYNQLTSVLGQWKTAGDIAEIPRYSGIYNNFESTRYLEDGSFLRLKEASLGYNFPARLFPKNKTFRSLRVYLKSQNLFTLTKYKGLDPEVNYNADGFGFGLGTDFFTFPHARVFLIGINLEI